MEESIQDQVTQTEQNSQKKRKLHLISQDNFDRLISGQDLEFANDAEKIDFAKLSAHIYLIISSAYSLENRDGFVENSGFSHEDFAMMKYCEFIMDAVGQENGEKIFHNIFLQLNKL